MITILDRCKEFLVDATTGEIHSYTNFKSHLTSYNTRIKVYSNGSVEIRKYKSALSNNKGSNDKRDILTLKREWLQNALDEYEKIKTPITSSQMLKLESQIKKYRDDIKEILEKKSNKENLKEKIESDSSLKVIRKDSLSRTRNTIIDFATEHELDWKSFVTLTFADNIGDVSEANKYFQNYIDQCQRWCRKNNREFLYLGVPEFQKRGAVHYHFLCNIECNSFLFPRQSDGRKIFSKKYKRFFTCYNAHYWNKGFSSVQDFSETTDDFNPVAYIVKYLYKDLDSRLWGHKKVLRSLKLRKPIEIKTIDSIHDVVQLETYLEKKCIKKEFDHEPLEGSYQIPFHNTDYNVSDKNYSNIDEFNLVVSNICKIEKYNDEVLPF